MRKYLILVSCLSLFIIFSGCGDTKATSTTNNSNITFEQPIDVVREPEVNISSGDAEIDNSGEQDSTVLPDIEDGVEDENESEEVATRNSEKRVICLGDSLTEGTGGNGVTFPDTLHELSGAEVLNYGVYAEELSCMSARYGSNPQYLVEDIVIPADTTPVRAQVDGKYGYEMLLVFGNAGINNVTLGGIEGTYSFDGNGDRAFTRLTPGEELALPQGTQLYTHAMLDKRSDDILVLWGGANDAPQTSEDIKPMLDKIDEIIKYHGNNNYVVVSLTNRHSMAPAVDEFNTKLSDIYGAHYLDIRTYLVNESLNHLGIAPTEKDLEAINRGDIPYSIRASMEEEENHGNAAFYRIIGELTYKKLQELGYLY